mmetsp:Transcript_423/g.759  ORF Transcript_423/g.759 Transcript_423/m.759 type:complete len:277 (-) Transcript_423:18-848(-)
MYPSLARSSITSSCSRCSRRWARPSSAGRRAHGRATGDGAVRGHVQAPDLLVQGVDVGGLLLVRGDERLEVWAGLRLHVLAHEDREGVAAAALDLEGGADDGDADLGLVDVGHGVRVGLLELADELLGVAGGHAGIGPRVEGEPLLEDARAVALCEALDGDAEDAEAARGLGREDGLRALVDGHAQHRRDADLHAQGLRAADDLCGGASAADVAEVELVLALGVVHVDHGHEDGDGVGGERVAHCGWLHGGVRSKGLHLRGKRFARGQGLACSNPA